jgi:hypothetical protein
MRLASGLLTALLVGLSIALVATWSSRRLLLMAGAVAATPMILVFGSTVNPSGLEMSAALCVWTGLLILVLEHAEHPPLSLVVACGTAASLLVLTRALSPLWLALMVCFVAVLRPEAIRPLATHRRVKRASAFVAVAVVIAVTYELWARPLHVLPVGAPVPLNASWSRLVQAALDTAPHVIYQFAGTFGWNFTHPPLFGMVLLAVSLAAVMICAFVTSERRQLLVLAALILTALILPLVIVVSQAPMDGIVWQARDGFPLYCGVIVVAGAIARYPAWSQRFEIRLPMTRPTRSLVAIVATCVALSQLADLFWVLRSYTLGLLGPLNIFSDAHGRFYPPIPIALLFVAAVGLCAAYGWWLVRLCEGLPSASTLAVTNGGASGGPIRRLVHNVITSCGRHHRPSTSWERPRRARMQE